MDQTILLEENTTYVLGRTLLLHTSTLAKALYSFVNKYKDRIILITDESHLTHKVTNQIANQLDRVLLMSATQHKLRGYIYIERKEEDVNTSGLELLRTDCELKGYKNPKTALKKGIDKYLHIKDLYVDINPVVLIQVKNREDYSWVREYLNVREIRYYDAADKAKDKSAMFGIKNNDSQIQAIIFKHNIAVGWNIPRASILIQLRKVKSTSFQKQIVGRIKRNNKPNNPDYISRKYWIYKLK